MTPNISIILDKKVTWDQPLACDIRLESFEDYINILSLYADTVQNDKNTLPLFSSAKYKEGTSRKIQNVSEQTCLVFDFDQPTTTEQLLKAVPFNKIIYKSFSHTDHAPKYRMLLEIDQVLTTEEWFKEVYEVIGKFLITLGLEYDTACNDYARYFYMPVTNGQTSQTPDIEYHHTGMVIKTEQFKVQEVKPQVIKPIQNVNINMKGGMYFNSLSDTNFFPSLARANKRVHEYYSLPAGEHHVGIYKLACSLRAMYFHKWKQDMYEHDLLLVMEYIDHQDSNGFAANHGKSVKKGNTYVRNDCKNVVANAVSSCFQKYDVTLIKDKKNDK